MNALCEACSTGPADIDGHSAMLAQSLGDMGMEFKCGNCGALWIRAVSGLSAYRWIHHTRESSDPGMLLPPLSGASAGF